MTAQSPGVDQPKTFAEFVKRPSLLNTRAHSGTPHDQLVVWARRHGPAKRATTLAELEAALRGVCRPMVEDIAALETLWGEYEAWKAQEAKPVGRVARRVVRVRW